LIALDAATGQPCEAFGKSGSVDLTVGAEPYGGNPYSDNPYGASFRIAMYSMSSPPAVVGDLVIVGSAIRDNVGVVQHRGVVRAYDARSGALRWTWDPIPREAGQPGYKTWEGKLAHRTGAANVWAPISVDPALDLVFLPTTSPSPDVRSIFGSYIQCCWPVAASSANTRVEGVLKYRVLSTMIGVASKAPRYVENWVPS
jgi:quinoprotein glucose dehydrogenase